MSEPASSPSSNGTDRPPRCFRQASIQFWLSPSQPCLTFPGSTFIRTYWPRPLKQLPSFPQSRLPPAEAKRTPGRHAINLDQQSESAKVTPTMIRGTMPMCTARRPAGMECQRCKERLQFMIRRSKSTIHAIQITAIPSSSVTVSFMRARSPRQRCRLPSRGSRTINCEA